MRHKTNVRTIRSGDAVSMILKGDPRKQPEPSECRIVFPGGHVAVTRCSDGSYWAHIGRNRPQDAFEGGEKEGRFLDARIDHEGKHAGETIELAKQLLPAATFHVAIRIAH